MKKVLIAVLVIMTVFCSAAFAANGLQNYSGLGAGYGFSNANIEDTETIKSQQLVISFTDYGFVDRSPVGLFADVSLVFNVKRTSESGGITWEMDPSVGFTGSLGPSFKFDMGDKVDLILGVGFQVYHEKWANYIGDFWVSDYDTTRIGVALDAQASYNLGKHFAIAFGVGGSVFFYESLKEIERYHTYDISPDSFFEYRVSPKIMAYYVY